MSEAMLLYDAEMSVCLSVGVSGRLFGMSASENINSLRILIFLSQL